MLDQILWLIVFACIIVLIGILYWELYEYYLPNQQPEEKVLSSEELKRFNTNF